MSPRDEDEKLKRSAKLCQLIYDRQIDSEISYEIRKLLEEGVLIDFQDQKRNQNTATHLAVDKGDVICVKFLLQFEPSLEVKDEDGKTPIDLAESKGDQNILNVLMNSTVDVVNASFIEAIDYESLTRQKIEAIKSRSTFKVLKLTNCPSANKVWMKLIDGDYATTLNESSHLFVIAIDTNETDIRNNHELMKKVLSWRRPMIVQLTSLTSQTPKIYFKDDSKNFVEITDTTQITQEEFNKAAKSDDYCNLMLLVTALLSNLFGHFTGNLLATKLNTSEDRSEAVNQFVKSNALCHRFFKLFEEGQPQIDRVVATLAFKGDQSLLALLDLPFDPKNGKLKLSEYQQDVLSVVDSSGSNLLIMAAEQNNLAAVKLLLRCGSDFNYRDDYENRASDACWKAKAFECMTELIEAGSPYPYYFAIGELDESSEAHERINAMIEAVNSFHKSITKGKTGEVEKFIASHPHIKHAYDTVNKGALTVALESNEVEIFSLLMSEGFEPGGDDEYYTALEESKFKSQIRTAHRKYFKEAFDEPHLKRLVDKFRLSFGSKDRAKCSTIIRKMFDELNEIDELIPILQICSTSDKLRIVFDFNCDSVMDMDPTSPSNAPAAVYPVGGFVYVGAKNHETEFFKVIGTLIHELTHYAMKLTYENGCKPYEDDDIEATNGFEAIARDTKRISDKNPSTDAIVATVFSLYSEALWDIELIVRVPHLLAQYKKDPKGLKAAERNTPELFHFYREITLKDVERQSKVLLQEYLINKINNQTGIARKIENMNINLKNVELHLSHAVYVLASNAPQLTLAMLSQIDCDGSQIFVTLEQVAIGNILDKIAKVNAKESSTTLIVDCIGLTQKYQESLRKLLKSIKNIKTIALVMTEAESSKVKENFPKIESKTFDHKWGELTETSKVHLLDQSVIFQGVETKLNELVAPSSEAMNFFPLGSIVDCKDFKIGHDLHQTSHNFYIPRKFVQNSQANAKSFEELSRDNPKIGAMIISDEAGSGKSVALFEIAKVLHVTLSDRWVVFVDLKRHIESFKSVKDHEKIESFEDFVVQNILKSEPKFDRELFLQMFQAGKTFVLFDGFDEICPNYKDLLLHVLKLFEPESGNRLYVTSRPHLEADLEGVLGNFVFKIETFSEESQTSFLREYWRSVGFEISHEDFEVLSKRLLEKFSEIATSNLVGLPLLIRMTAEIFQDQKQENLLRKVDSLSIGQVFREFVEKYLARWTNNENEISRGETVEFVMSGGVLEVHHNIALNHIFVEEDFVSFHFDESDVDKISRVGLIRYDKKEKTFQFIHQTFAEYFVADFIWFHLNRNSQNPSHDCHKAVEVLIEVVTNRDVVLGVVRPFLDQILKAAKFSPTEAFCKSVAKLMSETFRSTNRFDFLRKNMETSHENLTNLLLSIVKQVEAEVLIKMLLSKTSLTACALLDTAAYESSPIVSKFCDLIASTDIPKEIYREESRFGNVLLNAARNENCGVLTTLCTNLNSAFTIDEIKIMLEQKDEFGQNIVAIANLNSADEKFLELISLLPNYLSPDEIRSLLLEVDSWNKNFMQVAAAFDKNSRFKLKFDFVKSNFSTEEQKNFFYKPANAQNLFQRAAQNQNEKIFETVIEATRDVLSVDEIKSMLIEKDPDGSNVLHIATPYSNETKLNELNLLLRERLSDEEIRSLLLEVNKWGDNCFRLAANNTELGLRVFRETIGNLLPIEDQTRLLHESSHEIDIIRLACGNYTDELAPVETIKRLLTTTEKYGYNAFQEAAFRRDIDTWNKMISFAQARFSAGEMKSFLTGHDDSGENCLHLTVSNNSKENMVEAICETIKSVGWSVEDQKNFVQQKNCDERNVFHLAAANLDLDKTLPLYDALGTILSKDEIKEMLKAKDADGNNILCVGRKCRASDFGSCDLLPFLKAVLTYEEIKNLFFDVNCEGENFFHCGFELSSKFEIKSVTEAIKEILDRNDQKKFFGVKMPNIFHLAVKNVNRGIFSTTHECLKDVLTVEEIKSLVQEVDSKNQNVLLLICLHDMNDNYYDARYIFDDIKSILRDFLKVLKAVCDLGELINFLTSSDNYGSNCLHLAAEFKDQRFLKELFSFIQNELSVDDQRNLISKCDNNGNNVFKYTCRSRYPEVLSLVELFAREILTENQIEEMMVGHLEIKKKRKTKCACM